MNSHKLSWITSSFLLALGLVACGDDENVGPSDGGGINLNDDASVVAGSGSQAGEGGGGGSAGNGGSGDDEDAGQAGAGGEGGGGQAGQGGAAGTGIVIPDTELPDCPNAPNNDADDCWELSECSGQNSEQFLQQCSDNCIAPFDNATRIEGWNGTLPPLN